MILYIRYTNAMILGVPNNNLKPWKIPYYFWGSFLNTLSPSVFAARSPATRVMMVLQSGPWYWPRIVSSWRMVKSASEKECGGMTRCSMATLIWTNKKITPVFIHQMHGRTVFDSQIYEFHNEREANYSLMGLREFRHFCCRFRSFQLPRGFRKSLSGLLNSFIVERISISFPFLV